jgi:hypothetical protein
LHFFKRRLTDDSLVRLPENSGYLGYCVLRSIEQGRVGRTVLAPPPSLSRATLALIEDEVSLFGNPLSVRGVPFCQQDGEYLRCAQAAVWMCHYAAQRKRLVGRRTTAQIVEETPHYDSPERALPSKGMTLNQLQAVFGSLGQPALFYGLSNMPRVRGVPDPTPAVDANGRQLHPGLWDSRLFSVVCRYLNSGFPVLIGSSDHAFVLVGWFRDATTGAVRFVATDDQVGPYEVIDSPFTHYKAPWRSILVPLPPRVFLTGESAESAAYQTFRALGVSVNGLKPLADALDTGHIQLRSALKEGRAFKAEVQRQASSKEVLRELRFARLPHWVWLVEAHRVGACQQGSDCVYAAALYDSTSFDFNPRPTTLAVPGLVGVYPPDGGSPVSAPAGPPPWASLMTAH